MAIVDMKGTVSKDQPTMTGMVNEAPKTVDAPKLSGMNKLFERKSNYIIKNYHHDNLKKTIIRILY